MPMKKPRQESVGPREVGKKALDDHMKGMEGSWQWGQWGPWEPCSKTCGTGEILHFIL